MHKITIVGKEKVGKTTLKARYLGKQVNSEIQSTLGVDYSSKTTEIDGQKVVFQIWDLAGQDSFKVIRRHYFVNVSGVILVYSLNDANSLFELKSWILDIWSETPRRDIPLVFVANKSDLAPYDAEKQEQFKQFKEQLITEMGITTDKIKHVVASALLGENVDKVFNNIFLFVSA